MSKKVSLAAKELLVNTIVAVNHQNRVLEEKECWGQLSSKTRRSLMKRPLETNSRRSDRSTKRPRPHSGDRRKGYNIDEERAYHEAIRQRQKAQKGPDETWGHSGFQELYPDQETPQPSLSGDRKNDTSDSSSESESTKRKHRKRKKKHGKSEHSSFKSSKRGKREVMN